MTKGTGTAIAGGVATHVVAIICWYVVFKQLATDLLKFWVNLILPGGALVLGVLGGCGFWFAARAANRPSTPDLKLAAVAIALVSVCAIRFLGYWTLEFDGTPVHTMIGFGDYLSETLGHARMSFSRYGSPKGGVELGSFGYVMEAAQAAAYAVFSYAFVAKLPRGVRCDACEASMDDTLSRSFVRNDPAQFRALYDALPAAAPERMSALSVAPSDRDGPHTGALQFTWRLAECPKCGNAALAESAEMFTGEYFEPVTALERVTRFDRHRAARSAPAPATADAPPPPRTFGRRVVP